MKVLYLILFVLAFGLFGQSCNIINPKEEIPTYIYIDSFTVQNVAPGVHGSVSQKITDAWVYLENDIVGTYELPAKIPLILFEDSSSLSIRAGIWDNGISRTRIPYPFYLISNHAISPSPGNTIEIFPTTSYNPNLTFHLIEDFELGNSFIRYQNADTTVVRETVPATNLRGSQNGLIELGSNGANGAQSITTQAVQLPQDLQSYVEMDYQCDIPLTVVMQISGVGAPVVTGNLINLNERSDWNKVYINLTQFATAYPGSDFNFMVKAELPDGRTQGFVRIDNFKVLSF